MCEADKILKFLRHHNLKYLNQAEHSLLGQSDLCKDLCKEFELSIKNIFDEKYPYNELNPMINKIAQKIFNRTINYENIKIFIDKIRNKMKKVKGKKESSMSDSHYRL